MKIYKFKLKKIVLDTVWGDQFLYISLKFDYKYNSWLLQSFPFVSPSPSLIATSFFYTLFLFHLYPPHAGQMVGIDTCPISTFLKFLYDSCKGENHYLGIASTLMQPKG